MKDLKGEWPMKKKLFRLLVVLAMIVMPVTGVMINAEAASNLMLGTAVSNNPDTRVFTVKNNGEATTFAWEATGTGVVLQEVKLSELKYLL